MLNADAALMDRHLIMELIPHKGDSCLLDRLMGWSDSEINCQTRTHLAADNPLKEAGRLHPCIAAEYGMQAAALHGALRSGDARARGGLLIAVRGLTWHVNRLDDEAFGAMTVIATLEGGSPTGHSYAFKLAVQDGFCLAEGRGTVVLR